MEIRVLIESVFAKLLRSFRRKAEKRRSGEAFLLAVRTLTVPDPALNELIFNES